MAKKQTPRTPEGRVSRVAEGDTINGTYGLPPGESLEAFKADLKELIARPTNDAFMSANRALHWRTAELRFHGHEPVMIPPNAPHYPPDDFDFGNTKPIPFVDDARAILAAGLKAEGELPGTHEALTDPGTELDRLERAAVRAIGALLLRADQPEPVHG